MMLALLPLLALAAVARGAYPVSLETRVQQLEQEVWRLREENRQQQLELESQTLRGPMLLPGQVSSNAPFAIPTTYDELSSAKSVPPNQSDALQQLASDVKETQLSLQRLESKVDQLGDLTVSLLDKQWSATVTGAMIGEMIFSEQRPVIPSAIVLLSPDFGRDTPTLDIHGKSSKIGVLFRGPDYRGFQTGGAMLAYFFGENFLADIAGINLIGGYVELKDDRWRFLFGRAGDLINPRRPDTIDFNSGRNAGNLGFTRGQFRAERYIRPTRNSQITGQFALCNPIATAYNGNLSDLVEDNGWPLLEGRAAFGVGPVTKKFGIEQRRYEIGGSGALGQLRHATLKNRGLIDVWLFGFDGKADLTERCGVKGEFFCGQAIGNLNGGIMQIANSETGEGVRTIGGWGDFHFDWTERLRTSFGFGIDNPVDSTVAPGFPTRNAFAFANLILEFTSYAEVGFEIARWDTDFAPAPELGADAPGDNEAMIYRTRVVLRF